MKGAWRGKRRGPAMAAAATPTGGTAAGAPVTEAEDASEAALAPAVAPAGEARRRAPRDGAETDGGMAENAVAAAPAADVAAEKGDIPLYEGGGASVDRTVTPAGGMASAMTAATSSACSSSSSMT
jgi:hypothetical protein